MNTILNIFKPSGMRSFEVVEFLRERLKERKVGYAGILDAPAEGVLLVGVGKATKLLDFFVELPKEYEADILLGTKTDTGDISGTVIEKKTTPDVSEEEIRVCLKKFVGELMQTPPMYSAQKVDGTPLHKLARKGINIKREPKKVTIYDIELKEIKKNTDNISFKIKVICSKGTYIRVLAEDIASNMGSIGTLLHLRRTAIGPFRIEDAVKLESVNPKDIPSLEESLKIIPSLTLSIEEISRLRRYGFIPNRWRTKEPFVKVVNQSNMLKGLGKLDKEKLVVTKWLTLQK